MACELVQSEMLTAVEVGDLPKVKELVDRHGLYGIEDYPRGSHLLTRALWRKHQDVAEYLLKKGAEVNCQRSDCYYKLLPLHIACENGYTNIIKMLVEKGANVNLKDNKHRTPLYYSNGIEIVEILLGKNADFNIVDMYGNNPLHHLLIDSKLSQETKLGLVGLFVGHGAVPISRKDTLMHELIEHRNSPELLRAVLVFWKHKLEARSESGDTVLHYAARHGRDKEFRLLVEEGADVNARDANGSSPLHIVVKGFGALFRAGKAEQIDSTLELNSRVGSIKTTLSINNFLKMMEFLARRPSLDINSIDDDTFTALHYVIQYRVPYAAGLLLELGADPNAATCLGQTPLSLAVANKDGSSIKTLLNHGADVSVLDQNTLIFEMLEPSIDPETFEQILTIGLDLETRNSSGDTALHLAIRRCYLQKIVVLLRYGARLDASNADDMCPLHLAARLYCDCPTQDRLQAVKALLESWPEINTGRTINLTDKRGTALHYAVEHKSIELVKLLLEHGADVNVPNCSGQTPLAIILHGKWPTDYMEEGRSKVKRMDIVRPSNDSYEILARASIEAAGRSGTPPWRTSPHVPPACSAQLNVATPSHAREAKSPARVFSLTHVILKHILEHLMKRDLCNQKDAYGNTALHLLAGIDIDPSYLFRQSTDSLDYFRRFVSRCDPNIVNNLGETPLHIASKASQSQTVQILLRLGANVMARTNEGLSALHIAARTSMPNCIEVLSAAMMRSGAVLDIDTSGKTAMHHAVDSLCGWVIEILSKHGLCSNSSDYTGKTPFQLALDEGTSFAFKSLVKHLIGDYAFGERSKPRPTIDDALCGQDFAKLCEAASQIIERLYKEIDHSGKHLTDVKCDKFLMGAILDSSLCIPKFAKVLDINKLYWLDAKTDPDCLLMKLPGVMKDSCAKLALKLFEAKLFCGKELLARVSTDELEEFELDCAEEVIRLKRAKLYDFLHNSNPNAFRTIFNTNHSQQDDNIRRVLLLDEFPLYKDLILSKIWRDSMRIELLSRARASLLGNLNKESPLTNLIEQNDVADNILGNFTNFELMLLIARVS